MSAVALFVWVNETILPPSLASKAMLSLFRKTRLISLISFMSPAFLPDIVKVVWTGRSALDKSRLRSAFRIRKHKVYNALQWLVKNHEDYRKHVTLDHEMMNAWDST